MPACIIKSCQRTSRGKRSDKPRFHVFPPVKNPKFPLWLRAIGMSASEFSFVPSWRRYICSNHFTDDSYKWHLLKIPLGNRKLREDAVPNLLLLTTDKDAKSCSVESEDSSSESEYATEFESESDYESEYDSLSTSEVSFDLNEEITVTNPVKNAHPDTIGIGQSDVYLRRKDKGQRKALTPVVDTPSFNWTACRDSRGKDGWSKIRDVVTQPDNILWRRVGAASPEPNSVTGFNQEVRFSQDSIRSINQDHRYSMQVKGTNLQSRKLQEYVEIASVGENCQMTHILTTPRANSEEFSIFSTLSSPKAASDQESTYEPGSDVESIESLDIDAPDSNDDTLEDYAPTKESLVFLNESGQFLVSSMVVEEHSGDARDNDTAFHKNVSMYNEPIDIRERPKLPFMENDSFVIKGEFGKSLRDTGHNTHFNKIDMGNSRASEFGEHQSFNASHFANVKMEVHEDNICSINSGEPEEKDESNVPDEENEFSNILIKSEPIDPVDNDQGNVSMNENRCVVYESCLRELLKRCLQCGASVHNTSFNYHESALLVTMICADGHRILWKSRPEIPFQFTDVYGELT